MKILIDATNIIAGGGVSHLTELLNVTDKELLAANNISTITVIGADSTLNKIKDKDFIKKISLGEAGRSFTKRFIWKLRYLNSTIKQEDPDIVFNPGGGFVSGEYPFITMCRNMLVFETEEANRFGLSLNRLRFYILKIVQSASMQKAKGVIFISEYASMYVREITKLKINDYTIIHHGVSDRFERKVKEQLPLDRYSADRPFKLLYVSIVNVYKHHDTVAQSVVNLHAKGYPVELTLVGEKAPGFKKFEEIYKANKNIINYSGKISFDKMQDIYQNADMFVFASTCENMPNILIEAMNAGLPIACSNKLPMPEFLKDGGEYFNALDVASVEKAIEALLTNAEKRQALAQKSYKYSKQYNWYKCASETFKYISYAVNS